MANQKYTLTFDAKMEVGQIKSSVNEIQKVLTNLNLPANFSKNIQKNIDGLNKSLQDFEIQSSKKITSKTDFSSLEKNAKKIEELFTRIKLQFRDLGNLSGKDLDRLFPDSVIKNIQKATNAINAYKIATDKANTNIASATKKVNDQRQKEAAKLEALNRAQEKLNKNAIAQEQAGQKIINKTNTKDIEEAKKKLDELIAAQEKYNERVQNNQNEKGKTYNYANSTKLKAQRDLEELKQLKQGYEDYSKIVKANETTLKAAQTNYDKATESVTQFQNILEQVKQTAGADSAAALDKLYEELSKIDGIDLTNVEHNLENAEKILEKLSSEARTKLSGAFEEAKNKVNEFSNSGSIAREKVDSLTDSFQDLDARAREVSSLKSRIQYFFGLNNAIQLVRRTVRSAYQTISELDKAMTETAVVTDFTVSDMWSKLPDYTKRANELGVATLDAYKAATLYYQQGLKTNEVTALSNETLKMARIAGLEAAEATDRMTNALRGFNMELNETNAQRVDDVYSQLAAITASNVDEISTAMTKVASLAHNANMEFENTAAFLAQIIETTRESAETAGTALKTVVARFSEVKKLYSENEISGTDEEGELIDVNKVSVALRSAGIDLNKYFLGEVGLDDIFIELASKWDNLTNIQQRYIATQAAGSRQQSRFIALMSDYARTQELTAAAYNSAGASAKQFQKTQESLQSKLARLKNAWDEFTMSITNSALVKAGVDILTTILNIVNKLTSGFGTLTEGVGGFVNALAKIALVTAGLGGGRVLTSGLTGILGSFVGKGQPFKVAAAQPLSGDKAAEMAQNMTTGQLLWTGVKQPFTNILNARKKILENNPSAAGYRYTYANTLMGSPTGPKKVRKFSTYYSQGGEVPKTLLGAIGNSFIKQGIGKSLNEGLKNTSLKLASKGGIFGKIGANSAILFSGAAGGAATLATALAGVTAAAVAAGIAIKKIYDASPTGQLKIAEKLQDQISQTYNDLQSANSSLKSIISSYHDAQEQLKLTTYGTEEWAEALNNVNNTVLDIIEKFPTLAQYLTTSANGVMSLNEEGLKAYQEELTNRVKDQAFMKMAASGNVAQKKAATLTGEAAAQQSRLATAQFRAAFGSRFSGYDQETINALSENFDYAKWAKEAAKNNDVGKFLGEDFWVSKKQWRERYYEATGAEAPDSWSSNEIASALARFDALPEIEKQLNDLADFVKSGKETENLEKIITGDRSATLDEGLKNYLQTRNKPTYEAINDQYGLYGEAAEGMLADLTQQTEQLDKEFLLSYLNQNKININDFLKVNNFDSIGEAAEKLIEQAENIQAQNEQATKDTEDIFSQSFTDERKTEIYDAFKAFAGEIGENLEAEEYYKIGEVYKQLGIAGVSDFGIFDQLRDTLGTDEEKLKTFYSILSSLDVTDANSIEKTFNQLETLGVDFSNLGGDAKAASREFINLTHAVREFNLDELKKEVASTSTFLKGLSERDETNRTFTEEEFNQFIKGTDAEKNFIYTGIEGQEYVYYGDQLNTIINILSEQLSEQILTNKEQIDRDVNIGEAIENGPYKVLESIINSKGIVTDLQKTVLDATLGQYGISFAGLSQEKAVEKAQELLGLTGDQLKLNKQQQTNYEDYAILPQYMHDSVSEIYGNEQLNDVQREKILKAQLQTNETAAQVHDHILETLKKQGVEESKALKIARDLSLIYAEQAKKIDKINDVISKNKDALKAGNKAAITNVAKQLASVYGLKNQNALEGLVDQHKEDLLEMSEDDEAYYRVLSALHEQWMQENSQSYQNLSEISNQWLQNLNDKIESVPPLEIYTNVDASAFDNTLLQMFDSVEDFEKYIAGLGWAINWEAMGNVDKTDLQSLLSGEMHLVRISGGGSKGFTGGGGSSGGGGGNSSWKNEQDRLYNLLQDIAEEQRKQTKLQEDYDRITSDSKTDAQALINNVAEQLKSYQTSYGQQALRYVERTRDIAEYRKENEAYSQYVWYNEKDKTVEIDWTSINALKESDKDTYDKIVEIIGHFEQLESDRDTAEDEMRNIEQAVKQLENIWRDAYIEFENQVRDALIASRQQIIDNYSELNTTLNNTASEILQSLQNEINLQRQIRDNTKTEEDINQKEARLAYLKRDTTGRNDQEIRQLEKELDENRQNYEDNLVDQAINRLSDQNNKAAEQREHQIEIMQAQLDYQQKNGEFNDEVTRLINEGIDETGALIHESELEGLLKNNNNWDALTDEEKEKWADDLNKKTEQVRAFLNSQEDSGIKKLFKDTNEIISSVSATIQQLIGRNITYEEASALISGLLNGVDTKIAEAIAPYQTSANYSNDNGSKKSSYTGEQQYKIVDDSGNTVGQFSNEEEAKKFLQDKTQKAYDSYHSAFLTWKNNPNGGDNETIKEQRKAEYNRWLGATVKKYKTGGLNTTTGPAWLDGTKSKPEYVLNADQTDAFLKLAEALPQLLRAPASLITTTTTQNQGDIYLDLVMNVDQIADDYDVDKIADRVKEIIYDASSYRNVNVLNFIK